MNPKQYAIYHENKKHTSEDFPYNTYICSIPLDFDSVKTHWHDEIEIIVIKKGEGIITVDLDSFNVKSGDIVFVSTGQLHSIRQKESAVMEYENILFKPALLCSSGQDFCREKFLNPMFSGEIKISPLISCKYTFHRELLQLINNIDSLCDSCPIGYQLAVKGYLFQIMYILVSAANEENTSRRQKKSLEKIKSTLAYIEDNYQSNISIDDIASHCFYSKSFFMRFFKENMGMSFTRYLNDYRLEIAAKLLIDTDGNILDIAAGTGFENLSYFNRCFKRKYGEAPGKYRKKAKQPYLP